MSLPNVQIYLSTHTSHFKVISFLKNIFATLSNITGVRIAHWSRYCATNQKVVGSIPESVMDFFIDINPSDRNMTLGSTQPLNRNEYQENFLRVNSAGA
jgi:hypothetical protein